MNILALISLTAAGITLAACQSDTYRIKGSGDALKDGDTLYITSDLANGTPTDTLVVKDGVFETSGTTDSTAFCMLYNKGDRMIQPFFIEPGTIKIRLSKTPGKSKVSGTTTNEKWQAMADSIYRLSKKMEEAAARIYNNRLTNEEQEQQRAVMEKLNQDFKGWVLDNARRNTDNEFGYFILTYYNKDIIPPAEHLDLIGKLPDNMRRRPDISALQRRLEQENATAEGCKMADIRMKGPDGTTISIMAEIGRHKVTIIDFWASWCGPCRNDMPGMVALYNKYKDKGLGIVGISLDNKHDDWQTAIKTLRMEWPQMSDLNGWGNAAARMFNVQSIPYTVVVDNQGVILKKGLRGTALQEYVEERLGVIAE